MLQVNTSGKLIELNSYVQSVSLSCIACVLFQNASLSSLSLCSFALSYSKKTMRFRNKQHTAALSACLTLLTL
jgi:hypothetical protein